MLSGLDLSKGAVQRGERIAKKRGYGEYDFRQWDGATASIPYESASFDMVICSHCLEHLDREQEILAEVLRVLVPGGLFILMLPIEDFVNQFSDSHRRIYDRESVEVLLQMHRFEIIDIMQDHRIDNLFALIARSELLKGCPWLRSRMLGSLNLLCTLIPNSEALPF